MSDENDDANSYNINQTESSVVQTIHKKLNKDGRKLKEHKSEKYSATASELTKDNIFDKSQTNNNLKHTPPAQQRNEDKLQMEISQEVEEIRRNREKNRHNPHIQHSTIHKNHPNIKDNFGNQLNDPRYHRRNPTRK